jgi:hypothetical protein
LPVLTAGASPHPGKLFWRFKAGEQRAARDGDWKYLRISGNEFLFDVVKDPRERANLKDRYKDVFERLKNDWTTWNDTMLPERPRPAAYSNPGNFLADHYGVVNPASADAPFTILAHRTCNRHCKASRTSGQFGQFRRRQTNAYRGDILLKVRDR